MSKGLYAAINPFVKLILNSPLHRLMSHNTALLQFKGRKSGKTYVTPVSYHETSGHVHCFTAKENKWWHNLRHGDDVELTIKGRKLTGTPTVLADGSARVESALNDLLIAVPRDAAHAGVALDPSGQPLASAVSKASQRLVFISIETQDEAAP